MATAEQLEALREVFICFSQAVESNGYRSYLRQNLEALLNAAHDKGVGGNTCLGALQTLKIGLQHELTTNPLFFTRFYRFAFFACCERGMKVIAARTAVLAWQMLLTERFALLDAWCSFVLAQCRTISEDTWRQVLDFAKYANVDLELQDYDPESCWPVLVDQFVEAYKKTHQNMTGKAGEKRTRTDDDDYVATLSTQLATLCATSQIFGDEEDKADRMKRRKCKLPISYQIDSEVIQ